MSRFSLLLGGDLTVTPRLRAQIAGSRVLAADSGIAHAAAVGVEPELWVGDFDSSDADLQALMARVPRESFPPEKDSTDGELAVDLALAKGASELVLVGAFGGSRPDHAFLHMTMALRLAEAGTQVLLTSGDQEGVPLLAGSHRFDYMEQTLFSVLGFTDLVVSISGARWPLDHRAVPFGSSLTLSNIVSGSLNVELHSGRALLVAHP
ncbi:thiamine diphosphokinase [Tianweitania sp. BSSL-BM11]|uniref:Thiamine diphosphokinase n=1 Tax=Tianweitania aestuarii TaxID=2814886 RepID=A0ABS5RZB9_9HYPH|nr:thiamine diphosphokinase [Tianweitania aestuarii]MBS9722332.1 thiamine diphosphokinase [Tianweitania aestuarii]